MAILLPRIDDRTYDQLVDALRRQIPGDEWTDHNPSDPGIMLLELFAWLGEMVLWRMDQVPASHRERFLDFLIEPPEAVTIAVTFNAVFPAGPGATTMTIPAGTQLATSFVAGRRFVFETYRPLVLARPAVSPFEASGIASARAIVEVRREPLGVSDASPHQLFQLRPPPPAGGADADAPMPVLADFVRATAGFQPNPVVTVAGVAWRPVPSLLTDASRVGAPDAGRRYHVDGTRALIRFGDGEFGAMPPAGADIEAERYAVLDGTAALAVRAGDVTQLIALTVPPGVSVTFSHTDAEGGDGFFGARERARRGLRALRTPYRLVTRRDFERAVVADFNDFQQRAQATPPIVRASVEIDRKPGEKGSLTPLVDAPGYVTYVLVPGAPQYDEAAFRNPAITVAAKQAMISMPAPLWDRVRRFLDPRRLITTRLVHLTPTLMPLAIQAALVVPAGQSAPEVVAAARERLLTFLSPTTGDVHGRGWRLGRNVFRSQLFRLLEETPGVDHVEFLALSPADADGNVQVGVVALPVLQTLTVTARAG